MTDTLRELGRDRFGSLVNKAIKTENAEEKKRYMTEADRLAEYVFRAYPLIDFAYITGACEVKHDI